MAAILIGADMLMTAPGRFWRAGHLSPLNKLSEADRWGRSRPGSADKEGPSGSASTWASEVRTPPLFASRDERFYPGIALIVDPG